jgi:hypothetical protein
MMLSVTSPSQEKRSLLWHGGRAQRYRLDLSEDILAPCEAQLLPGFLGYARQEPRANAVLAQGHGRQDFVRVERIRCDDLSRQHFRIELRRGGSRARLTSVARMRTRI